jgi:alginate O-acetyltransferase complex protein AlgI
MLFCSQKFLVFFAAVFAVYWTLPWHRVRVWLLLVASFYFYACWNEWLALLICVSTAFDYGIARGLDAAASPRLRKLLLLLSLTANLGLLGYFKYANFFLGSLEQALHSAGAAVSLPVLRILLPVGISFYTFEAINYTVDVYRRKMRAERNLANFMLFILFFPHLVAGPIVRAADFLPQVHRRKRWDWPRMQLGAQYFLMGLVKKLVIADHLAQFCGPVFEHPENYNSGAIWMGLLAFTLRLYGDFSGYTDMALGTAHMLGYKLAQNFDMPYFAPNITEFWNRWHISLSSWLRDYIFIPLGGSRNGEWNTRRNLVITMTLAGLWHGANWTFVVFGMVHGLLLSLHRGFKRFCRSRPKLEGLLQSVPGTGLRVGFTFLVFMITLVLFYTASLESEAMLARSGAMSDGPEAHDCPVAYSSAAASRVVLHRMFVPTAGERAPLPAASLWWLVGLMVLCHGVGKSSWWPWVARRLPGPVLGVGYAATLLLTLVLAPDMGSTFIYFQF